MPYKKSGKKTFRKTNVRRRYPGKKTKVRQMIGEKPTVVEKIARYAGPIGTIAKTVAGIVSMVNCEKKFVDNAVVFTPSAIWQYFNPGSTGLISYMPQGLGDNARNGTQVKAHSLDFRIFMRAALPEGQTRYVPAIVRLVLVIDKECQGSLPGTLDIFSRTDYIAFNELDASKRYIKLMDKSYHVSDMNPVINDQAHFKFEHHSHFDETGTTDVSFARQNHIYLLAVSDRDVSTAPLCVYNARYKFYDN